MTRTPMCFQCIHYSDKERYVCKAFPNGIPSKIISDINYHFVKHEEQIGDYVFESKDHQFELFKAQSFKALQDQEWTLNAIKEASVSILNRMNASEAVQF